MRFTFLFAVAVLSLSPVADEVVMLDSLLTWDGKRWA